MGKHIHLISNVNEEERIADCAFCGRTRVKRKKNVSSSKGYRWECLATTRKYRHSNHESQGYKSGKCPICGTSTDKLVYDHSHVTNKFRGWICRSCNLGLGFFQDNVKSLQKAVVYLSNY